MQLWGRWGTAYEKRRGEEKVGVGSRTIPDFDRLVIRAGHNRLSIG